MTASFEGCHLVLCKPCQVWLIFSITDRLTGSDILWMPCKVKYSCFGQPSISGKWQPQSRFPAISSGHFPFLLLQPQTQHSRLDIFFKSRARRFTRNVPSTCVTVEISWNTWITNSRNNFLQLLDHAYRLLDPRWRWHYFYNNPLTIIIDTITLQGLETAPELKTIRVTHDVTCSLFYGYLWVFIWRSA